MTYYMVILKNREKIALRWTCPKNTFKVISNPYWKNLTVSVLQFHKVDMWSVAATLIFCGSVTKSEKVWQTPYN